MASPAILWKFEFSVTTVFVIEVGNAYMRFFKQGAAVTDSGGVYELTTTYAEADLFELQAKQINDVIYITHPDYPVQKLSRVADNSWTIEEVAFLTPALLDENLTDTTITPSGTTGSVTLTASSAIFESDHVDSYWRIGHVREGDSTEVTIDSNKNGTAVEIFGDYNVRSYGTWTCDILLQRSLDSGSTWKTIRKFEGSSDRNVDATGSSEVDAQYRLKIENYASATDARVVLEWNEHTVYGIVKITAFSSSTSVTATVQTAYPLSDTSATDVWSEGAWSAVRGYPRSVTVHEQRVVYGGTSYQPQTIWGTVVGDFENFLRGVNDSDSYAHTIAGLELNEINWLISQKELLIGTAGNEYAIGSEGGIITGSDVTVRLQSNKGSAYKPALVVNDSVLFIGRKGRKIFDIQYTFEQEKFFPQDLTLFAEHLTANGVVQMAYQKEPIPILWAVTADGILLGFTFDRDQNVMGWHWHQTDGLFESVVAIYGAENEDDNVYVIVKRTIGSTDYRYLELLDPVQWTAKEDYRGVDSFLTYTGSATDTFTGMDHLAGETIDALGDGVLHKGLIVGEGSSAGDFDLDSGATPVTKLHAGLPFTSIMIPFRLDGDTQIGVHMGRQKRIGDMYLRLLNSVGFEYVIDGDTYESEFPNPLDSQDLYDGEIKVDFSTGHSDDPKIEIRQSDPLPLHVLAIIAHYDVTG